MIACKLTGGAIAPIADAIATSEGLEEADLSWNPIRRWVPREREIPIDTVFILLILVPPQERPKRRP